MRSEGVHCIVNETEDPWLFLQWDNCAIYGDWRVLMSLVWLGGKQGDCGFLG